MNEDDYEWVYEWRDWDLQRKRPTGTGHKPLVAFFNAANTTGADGRYLYAVGKGRVKRRIELPPGITDDEKKQIAMNMLRLGMLGE